MPQGGSNGIDKREYEVLAAFRHRLRRFLRFSEAAARAHGLTPQQHQLLLAIKGTPGRDTASIGELAQQLERRHHSVVGLASRCEAAGLVRREHDPEDRRVIMLRLTPEGERILSSLTHEHRLELGRMHAEIAALVDLFDGSMPGGSDSH